MRILVICAAGASSTFVALRLRTAAAAEGLDWTAEAGAEGSVATTEHDLVLLGPHLAEHADAIRSGTDAPVGVLPPDIFDDRDGRRTLALARALISRHRTTTEGRP